MESGGARTEALVTEGASERYPLFLDVAFAMRMSESSASFTASESGNARETSGFSNTRLVP